MGLRGLSGSAPGDDPIGRESELAQPEQHGLHGRGARAPVSGEAAEGGYPAVGPLFTHQFGGQAGRHCG